MELISKSLDSIVGRSWSNTELNKINDLLCFNSQNKIDYRLFIDLIKDPAIDDEILDVLYQIRRNVTTCIQLKGKISTCLSRQEYIFILYYLFILLFV